MSSESKTPHLDRVQRYRWYRGGTYEGDSLIEDANGPLVRLDDVRAAIALDIAEIRLADKPTATPAPRSSVHPDDLVAMVVGIALLLAVWA
jgi:hypothetical protein